MVYHKNWLGEGRKIKDNHVHCNKFRARFRDLFFRNMKLRLLTSTITSYLNASLTVLLLLDSLRLHYEVTTPQYGSNVNSNESGRIQEQVVETHRLRN